MPRQVIGRRFLKHTLPSCTKAFEIETAQMRDLVSNGSFGRGATAGDASPTSHYAACFTRSAVDVAFPSLNAVDATFVGLFRN